MDNSLLKSDIFFFVTTIAVCLVSILLVIGIVYVINILRLLQNITKTVRGGAESVVSGINEAKQTMKEEGYVVGSLLDIFKRVASSKRAKRKSK